MPSPEGSLTISLYYNPEEPKPTLNKYQIKIIIENLKQFLEEVRFDQKDYEFYMKNHILFKEVLEKWLK